MIIQNTVIHFSFSSQKQIISELKQLKNRGE